MRKRRRCKSETRMKYIRGRIHLFKQIGIRDPDVIASKLECPRKIVVELLFR